MGNMREGDLLVQTIFLTSMILQLPPHTHLTDSEPLFGYASGQCYSVRAFQRLEINGSKSVQIVTVKQ